MLMVILLLKVKFIDMSCKKPVLYAFVFISFLVPLSVRGEGNPVTLKSCLEIALLNNPDIKSAGEEINRAKASYGGRKAEGWPQIYAKTYMDRGDDRYKKTSDGTAYLTETSENKEKIPFVKFGVGVEGTFSLFNLPQSVNIEIASRYITLAQLNEKKVRDSVSTSVKQIYYEVLYQHRNAELQKKIIESQERRYDSIRILVQTGDRSMIDQSAATVTLAQAKLDYQRMKNAEATQKSELKAIMGLLNDSTEMTLGEFPSGIPSLKYSLDEIYKFIEYSTDVQIAKINSGIQQTKIKAARSSHLPMVDLFGGYYYENPKVDISGDLEGRSWSEQLKNKKAWGPTLGFGFRASLSIYNGGRIEAAADESFAEYNKSLYENQRVLVRLRKDATNYFNRLAELRQQLEVSRLNIENARVNYTLAQKGYDAGIRDLRSLQDAEASYLSTEMWSFGAKKEYFQVLAALANLIGVDEEVLCAQ
jgi:multidrug efflux system outer membrane protein